MIDQDLAEMYGVATKALNQAVRRNMERFPEDFMFRLNSDETANIKSHFETMNYQHGGTRYNPLAFTEQGVAMLSSVLKSRQAVMVNIQIIRTFTKLREMMTANAQLKLKIENMERNYDKQFQIVFEAIRQLIEEDAKPEQQIGFDIDGSVNKKQGH